MFSLFFSFVVEIKGHCGFINIFLANSYFLFQISHVKSYKLRNISAIYHNFSLRYSWKELKKKITNSQVLSIFPILPVCVFFVQMQIVLSRIEKNTIFFQDSWFLIVQTKSTYSWVSSFLNTYSRVVKPRPNKRQF